MASGRLLPTKPHARVTNSTAIAAEINDRPLYHHWCCIKAPLSPVTRTAWPPTVNTVGRRTQVVRWRRRSRRRRPGARRRCGSGCGRRRSAYGERIAAWMVTMTANPIIDRRSAIGANLSTVMARPRRRRSQLQRFVGPDPVDDMPHHRRRIHVNHVWRRSPPDSAAPPVRSGCATWACSAHNTPTNAPCSQRFDGATARTR